MCVNGEKNSVGSGAILHGQENLGDGVVETFSIRKGSENIKQPQRVGFCYYYLKGKTKGLN